MLFGKPRVQMQNLTSTFFIGSGIFTILCSNTTIKRRINFLLVNKA